MTLNEAIRKLEFLRYFVFEDDRDALDTAIQALKVINTPVEDVAPVVHAHRLHCHSAGGGTHWLECGECRNPIDHADKYCRNCGAKLDEWEGLVNETD